MKNFWFIAALLFAPYAAAQVSSGTAFAVSPGLLVTNQHVVDGCASVDVVASDGRRTGAVVDADALIDLALIRVTGLKGATARLRSPRNVRLGEAVMVFGFPLSGSLTSGGNFTSGLVSGLRGLRDAAGEIQITAPVQPGNSGGPVLDASGLVVGVVQAKLDALRTAIKTGDIPQNVNFAVSLDVLAEFLAKNKVSVRDAAPTKPLDTATVAELAQSFTYRVECGGKAQQAAAPPGVGATQAHPQTTPDATLAAAAKEPGAKVTDSGLVIRMTKEGKGAQPIASSTVKVHYKGTFPDGKVFDSSYLRGEPIEFPLNLVIKCWTEGVALMKTGGAAKLTCPSSIAYGARGAGSTIPPNATLVFEVELLGIR